MLRSILEFTYQCLEWLHRGVEVICPRRNQSLEALKGLNALNRLNESTAVFVLAAGRRRNSQPGRLRYAIHGEGTPPKY